MKSSNKMFAVIGFIAMAAFSSCRKDAVVPVKPTTTAYRQLGQKTLADSLSGGQEPTKPPQH